MADSLSTGQGMRGRSQNYSFGGGSSAPRSEFDSSVPPGVDPEYKWRFGNSDRARRHGSTTQEREGMQPGYTPGYGRASNRNATGGAGSLTPQSQWDSLFTPRLGAQMQQQMGNPAPATPPNLPPAATTTPATPEPSPAPTGLPVLPPSPSLGAPSQAPVQMNGPQASERWIPNLPDGQRASATFVPGQNNPQSLAKRTRPPVDPLAV